MKKEEVLEILIPKGFILDKEISIPYGVQLVFRNGSKVSVYHTGKVNPQGKYIDLVNELLGRTISYNQVVPVAVHDTKDDHF